MMRLILLLLPLLFSVSAGATLKVITTTTDLQAIAAEVGGGAGKDLVKAESIAKGTQDPHYLEAKPSYMTKLSRADALIAVGLDLEVGWLPSIVRGARNPKIRSEGKGYLEVGPIVSPLEVPTGSVTRADGDVHPYGNPHVTLDPIRAGQIGLLIASHLGKLDPANAAQYETNAKALQARLTEKSKAWQARIDRSGVKKAITYHKTLNYFLNRFKVENSGMLEPKPGIPPTSGHILGIIQLIRKEKVPLVLIENYFESKVMQKIKADVPSIRSVTVPVAVEGNDSVKTLDDLYEALVVALESKG